MGRDSNGGIGSTGHCGRDIKLMDRQLSFLENHPKNGIADDKSANNLNHMITSPIFVRFPEDYERFVGSLSKQTWECGIIRELVSREITSGQLLDAGAGTGIGAKMLRKIGEFHITALDASPQMLERAEGAYDEIIVGDLATPPPGDTKYKAIVSAFDSLNYLSSSELTRFLNWAGRRLEENGVIIFDYSSPKLLRESWREKAWDDTDQVSGRKLEWRIRYLPDESRCHIQLTALDQNGSADWREDHYQITMDPYEMHCAARNAGLEIEYVRDIYKDTFSPDAHTHVFILRRHQPK